MRPPADKADSQQKPELLGMSKQLAEYLKQLTLPEIVKSMNVSEALAAKTKELAANWSANSSKQRAAIDSFLGDIYSGLQVGKWSAEDKAYSNESLRILSGLYGILKPLDGICPYRLEMGYKLPIEKYKNLYKYWGNSIAKTLPETGPIINLAAVEYSKIVTTYVDQERVITPSFLTISQKTNQPAFVVVHAKIARGAFASWLVRNRISNTKYITRFNEIGYEYRKDLSTPNMPVFVCKKFEGLGLSVRLS